MDAFRGFPVGRAVQDLDYAGFGIRAASPGHHGSHTITRDSAFDEDHKAIVTGDPPAAEGKAIYGQIEFL